ncbi:Ribosomal protein L14b/L23e [Cynara cardunculus var. scolymus]|uniref:Ribosomal protein L14b/L23e n=1 Tax=Cynara cardunculus var. scolymus TaxID=59895 RepID=A0A103XJX6_CYNCS|nr:Ribosomal protein L14b/L23e [Cynara cardunculus var. scolymus]
MSKRGRRGSAGNKFQMSPSLPVVNCVDNTGTKTLYIISMKGVMGHSNRLPQQLEIWYLEDKSSVIVNKKGELKGTAITAPIGTECGDLWARIESATNAII